jgi:hypothetical protein
MFIKKFANQDIAHLDWAKQDRAALLRSLHSKKVGSARSHASSGWSTDVAGRDSRSVHAYLAGKGDLRTFWWNLYSSVYVAVVPGADLERAMYSFHRLHHSLTIFRLTFAASVSATASDLEREGFVTAVRNCAARPEQLR